MKTIFNESAADFLMSQLEACQSKEDLILAFWFYWVESVTINQMEFQKVVANPSVNKWFLVEWEKEEANFEKVIAKYPNITPRDKCWFFCKCSSNLMSIFPKALLEQAKKREQKNTKGSGIRIETAIAKLN